MNPRLRFYLDTIAEAAAWFKGRMFCCYVLPLLIVVIAGWWFGAKRVYPNPARLADPFVANINNPQAGYKITNLLNIPHAKDKPAARMTLGTEGAYLDHREALVGSLSGKWSFGITPGKGARLRFSTGAMMLKKGEDKSQGKDEGEACFTLKVTCSGTAETVFETTAHAKTKIPSFYYRWLGKYLDPKLPDYGRWQDHEIDLGQYAGRAIQLTFETASDHENILAGWATPTLLERAPQTTNLLLIVVDGLQADWVGRQVEGIDLTPNLNRLIAKGRYWQNFIAPSNTTHASVDKYLSGRFPLAGPVDQEASRITHTSLAGHLARAGYLPVAITSHLEPAQQDKPHHSVCADFVEHLNIQRPDYDTHDVSKGIVQFFKAHPDTPSFMYVHYAAIGPDNRPPDKYKKDLPQPADSTLTHKQHQQLKNLWAQTRYVDAQIGQLIQWLDSQGILDHTAVVITADHGRIWRSHKNRKVKHNGQWRPTQFHHGLTLYQEEIRVPLIMLGSKQNPLAHAVVDAPCSGIDLAATMLALVNVDQAGFPGNAFLHKTPENQPIFSIGRNKKAMILNQWKYIRQDRRFQRYWDLAEKDASRLMAVQEELYNLREDPHEQHNLAFTQPEKLTEMHHVFYAKQPRPPGITFMRARSDIPGVLSGVIQTEGTFRLLQKDEDLEDMVLELTEEGKTISFEIALLKKTQKIAFEVSENQMFWIERLNFDNAPIPVSAVKIGPSGLPLAFRTTEGGRIWTVLNDLEAKHTPDIVREEKLSVHFFHIRHDENTHSKDVRKLSKPEANILKTCTD